MSRQTENDTNDPLVEQLMYEYAKQCSYILNKSLTINLKRAAKQAAEVCNEMGVDPATYVKAQIRYSPVLKNYRTLTPNQLCTYKSKEYVLAYVQDVGEADIPAEVSAQFRILGTCLENGWTEQLALSNPSFDFYPWFRILIRSEWDQVIIKEYGYKAEQSLSLNPKLYTYLKTIKKDDGTGLDFSRIPRFKQ